MCVNLERFLRKVVHISISPLSTALNLFNRFLDTLILQKDICTIYAQTLFTEFRNDIKSRQPYCEADPYSCTVAIADFGEDRAFYVWENIYVGGHGELPSDHGALVARLIPASGKYYVLDLSVTHPELEMDDTWVIDMSQSVEACVVSIANR